MLTELNTVKLVITENFSNLKVVSPTCRTCRDGSDGTSECARGPEVEEVSAAPDEEQGPEDEDDGRDPERDEDPQVVRMGNVIPG